MNRPVGLGLRHVICPACATAFALTTMPEACPACSEPALRSLSDDQGEADYFAGTMRTERVEHRASRDP
ncbi:hypothetical protein [Halorubrum vacuolatum]|uniref:Uncharacterized protein n=1 Tax=Halorubrum vacuolatum TaxID=63740 RepID=A0A238X114_HALVU|nr:hypothetical protein [Halorubrum vacuolatum]SNR52412.1 hypothetical protein SAMN06264855_11230 [Halorubrum vacuolatum]